MNSADKSKNIKRFIEVQLKPGEKYDYVLIQKRFDKVLAREENTELRSYRLILEKINIGYKSLIENNKIDVSDWYINKLREFIFKYRQMYLKKNKTEIIQQNIKNVFSQRESTNKSIIKTPISESDSKSWSNRKLKHYIERNSASIIKKNNISQRKAEFPPKVALFYTPDMDRGTYWQEANTDEFGCVVVCDSNDE